MKTFALLAQAIDSAVAERASRYDQAHVETPQPGTIAWRRNDRKRFAELVPCEGPHSHAVRLSLHGVHGRPDREEFDRRDPMAIVKIAIRIVAHLEIN